MIRNVKFNKTFLVDKWKKRTKCGLFYSNKKNPKFPLENYHKNKVKDHNGSQAFQLSARKEYFPNNHQKLYFRLQISILTFLSPKKLSYVYQYRMQDWATVLLLNTLTIGENGIQFL